MERSWKRVDEREACPSDGIIDSEGNVEGGCGDSRRGNRTRERVVARLFHIPLSTLKGGQSVDVAAQILVTKMESPRICICDEWRLIGSRLIHRCPCPALPPVLRTLRIAELACDWLQPGAG